MTSPKLTADVLKELSRQHGYIAKQLYVMESEPCGGMELISASLPEHLAYWVDLEVQGVLFVAGPFLPSDDGGDILGAGLIIFRAENMVDAIRIADQDPMHSSGARRYTIKAWLLNHLYTKDIAPASVTLQ